MTKIFQVTITGTYPLLMHADDVDWRDTIQAYQKDPDNKGKTVPGDDRTPAWKWLGFLYHDQGKVVMPADNIMKMMWTAARDIPTPASIKTAKSYRPFLECGVNVLDFGWPVIVNGGEIDFGEVSNLLEEQDFKTHLETVRGFGFRLFVKPVVMNGKTKNIRVRPMFPEWQCSGEVEVDAEIIPANVFKKIMEIGGRRYGLCDWRPRYGRFSVKVK